MDIKSDNNKWKSHHYKYKKEKVRKYETKIKNINKKEVKNKK